MFYVAFVFFLVVEEWAVMLIADILLTWMWFIFGPFHVFTQSIELAHSQIQMHMLQNQNNRSIL